MVGSPSGGIWSAPVQNTRTSLSLTVRVRQSKIAKSISKQVLVLFQINSTHPCFVLIHSSLPLVHMFIKNYFSRHADLCLEDTSRT